MANTDNGAWNATAFFQQLTNTNKLAANSGFVFCRVSGLDGFEEALARMQKTKAFVCVSDISAGNVAINNTPRTRRVKTVFLAMRHRIDDMNARQNCFNTMREIFRQFMSVLILEKTRLAEEYIFMDDRITFEEISQFFFSGCACAYFNITIDVFTDLRFNENEWLQSTTLNP